MNQIDWQSMRKRVLDFLNAKYGRMAESQRSLPYIVFQDPDTMESIPLSPNDMIREVTNLSEIGRKIISAEIQKSARVTG